MAVPKYQRIKNELKKLIISGKFTYGDKFYTEAELLDMYDVSSITVVRALNELVKEGYVTRKQGKGTFVSRARKSKMVAFSDIEVFPIDHDDVTVLSIERGNHLRYLNKLKLRSNQFYYKIDRIRQTDGQTYIYHQTYLPEQYVNANYPNLSYYDSIYQRFYLDYHINMNEEDSFETDTILFPTPTDVAKIMNMPADQPTVLQVKTTIQHSTGQVLEYVETHKKWDFYKIEIEDKKDRFSL